MRRMHGESGFVVLGSTAAPPGEGAEGEIIARYRRRRNTRRRGGASASAARAAGEERAARRPYIAHAAVAGLAERDRALGRHLRGDRRDFLYRPARRRGAGGGGGGGSGRDPDHDPV